MEQMKELLKAIASFQQECPVIEQAKQGYSYKYATLPQIVKTINPLMQKHGLGFTQLIECGHVVTTVFHPESGGHISSTTEIPQGVKFKGMNEFQVLGSAVSYLKRYALCSMLGIVTSEEDTDAKGDQDEKPTMTDKRFDTGLKQVQDGKITKEKFVQLVSKYELTDSQKLKIDEL